MNAIICSENEVATLTNEQLVSRFERVTMESCEMNCEEALNVLRREMLRRLNRTKQKS